jgi:hypothetical protein
MPKWLQSHINNVLAAFTYQALTEWLFKGAGVAVLTWVAGQIPSLDQVPTPLKFAWTLAFLGILTELWRRREKFRQLGSQPTEARKPVIDAIGNVGLVGYPTYHSSHALLRNGRMRLTLRAGQGSFLPPPPIWCIFQMNGSSDRVQVTTTGSRRRTRLEVIYPDDFCADRKPIEFGMYSVRWLQGSDQHSWIIATEKFEVRWDGHDVRA